MKKYFKKKIAFLKKFYSKICPMYLKIEIQNFDPTYSCPDRKTQTHTQKPYFM